MPTDPQEITTGRMFTLWRQRNNLKARIQKLNKQVKDREQVILSAMTARGLKGIESRAGERLTFVESSSVVYDQEKLRAKLARSPKGRAILKRCTVQVLDMQAIAAEVQAGNIPPKIVAQCSQVKKNAPYLRGGGKSE